jgi:predicted NAD/FAD-dependent oxidoreductase
MSEAGVVGAGLLGLAMAQRLIDQGNDVTLFEASGNLSGMTGTYDDEDLTWDLRPNLVTPTHARVRRALRTLDLDREVRSAKARTESTSASPAS